MQRKKNKSLVFILVSICTPILVDGLCDPITPPASTNSNLDNGVKGLNFIYGYINSFRATHQGKYPEQMSDLLIDMAKRPNLYGNPDFASMRNNLLNPDTKYSDDPAESRDPEHSIPYFVSSVNMDGSAVDNPAPQGADSVIAWLEIYFHLNSYHDKKDNLVFSPQGYYIVLRRDGKVEKIPYDESLKFAVQDYFQLAFAGQVGVPFNTVTYSEYWTQVTHLLTAPIGKPTSGIDGSLVLDNGGPESLIQLSRRELIPNTYGIDREDLWRVFDPLKPEFTLSDIQAGTTKLGLNTQVKKQTLAQLQKSGAPVLLFLQDDGRIVTLTAIDDDRAVVIDRGVTQNVEHSVLEKRYSGEALVPTKALMQNAAIVADDAVREVKLPSLDAEVPQQFVLRNTGTTPITLQLEYPLLGVTESKLSRDVIAPGETATLDLKVKWRSILKAPYQNVLVSIATNDPIVPRLQLAILLTPPKGAGQ